MIHLFIILSLLILALALPLGLLVAYFVWTVKTWRRGRKGLFRCQTSVVVMTVAALVFFLDLTPASHWYWERERNLANRRWATELTGITFSFGRPLYCYDSDRAFNGDGYSIAVYELTPEMARYFSSPPPEFFAIYPKKPDYRRHWKAVNWHTGPVRADEEIFINFTLAENAPKKEEARLEEAFKTIRRSLAKTTTHYAYFHFLHSANSVGDIDFFLIDPEERRLYIINNNT